MARLQTAAALISLGMGSGLLHAQAPETPEAAVRQVVVDAYVDGVFRNRDAAAVRSGFHPEFVMSVHTPDGIIVATLDMWLDRLTLDGIPSEAQIKHRFLSVDVTGETATVKMQIHEDGRKIYTDYLGLYRFPQGWRIVNKVFQSHD